MTTDTFPLRRDSAQLLMVLPSWIGGMSGTVAQTGNDKFDHVNPPFPLLGQHSGVAL